MQLHELACSSLSLHAVIQPSIQFLSSSEQLTRISQCLLVLYQIEINQPNLIQATWTLGQFNEQMWMGKSFTLKKYDFPTAGALEINFQYKRIIVKIIDPQFYMESEKVFNIPLYAVELKPGDYATVNLQAEYIEAIGRPENPCEEA